MPVLRATALIDAPRRTVAGLLRDAALSSYTTHRVGHRVRFPARVVSVGDEPRFRVRLAPGLRVPITTRITRADLDGLASTLVSGLPVALEHRTTLAGTLAGTLVTDEVRWTSPLGRLGRVVDVVALRRIVLRLLGARCADLRVLAEHIVDAGEVVVGAAIVRDARLLVAQRSRPAELAGRWELPGGRVEHGESGADALARECREELGVDVLVGDRVGPDLLIGAGRLLRVHVAGLADARAEPRALEHAELRWVGPAQLAALDWIPADRALLPDLRGLLAEPGQS